jgi:two-component system response regulator FixJ
LARTHPVYIVDDDPGMREWVGHVCEEHGLGCRGFGDGDAFLAEAGQLHPGCVLLDMRMPRRSGLQVQAELDRLGLAMKVVAMTGFGDVDTAVKSMKMGAVDFLEKPFPPEVLVAAIVAAFTAIDEQAS